jgi:PleD family two-component response regulator
MQQSMDFAFSRMALGGAGNCDAFHVAVSFGLAPSCPVLPVEQPIDRADKALYVANAAGQSRAVIWDMSMTMPLVAASA